MRDNFERPKEIITGEAKEAGQEIFAAEIKNEVVWQNKDVDMPFRLEEGKPTKLGVFLVEHPQKRREGLKVRAFNEHFRSALLGRVVFQDKEGRLYRDVDLKGMGGLDRRLEPKIRVEPLRPRRRSEQKYETTWGILNWGYAENDRELSEFFTKEGLRTHRVLAIIRLDEVLDERGRKISVTEAREKGYIKKNEEPVIAIRAFGTKARISEIKNEALLKDAEKMVAQEFGIDPKKFSDKEYAEWFAKTLGEQVGRIHRLGYYHRYLTIHNVTLDCRIVDLDTVIKLPRNKEQRGKELIKEDITAVLDTIDFFDSCLNHPAGKRILGNLFWQGYQQEVGEKFLSENPAIAKFIRGLQFLTPQRNL
ncbi:MAG: hypothetical protein HYW90_01715 [Candidatus Sungbacteria bacterium]|nr:hypothetical protein [Candidatus Sungbacteria bacterium]